MALVKIQLLDFRNFRDKVLAFSPGVSVVIGDNATGKTNILESIALLSTGKSFKAGVEMEMINYDAEITRIKGLITDDAGKIKLEAVLTRGELTINENPKRTEKVSRKKLLVNGVSKRLIDFAGNLKVVLFGPWDMDLATTSPSVRRRFLDSVLSLTDREYRRALMSYEKGVRQRNKLLYRIREEGASSSQLMFWNMLLIKNGDYLSNSREAFIDFANRQKDFYEHDFSLIYDKSAISESRLAQYAREEIASATTLIGPHRDDFSFQIAGHSSDKQRDLGKYGSRGEQRMGILWLKLAELSYVEEKTGTKPTLLLDDIFSELDHDHRELVFSIAHNQQTIITTADPHYLANLSKVEKIEL